MFYLVTEPVLRILSASETNDDVLSVFLGADGSYVDLRYAWWRLKESFNIRDRSGKLNTIHMKGKEVFSCCYKDVLAAKST